MVLLGGLEAVSKGEDLHRDVHYKILSAFRKSVVLWVDLLLRNYIYF